MNQQGRSTIQRRNPITLLALIAIATALCSWTEKQALTDLYENDDLLIPRQLSEAEDAGRDDFQPSEFTVCGRGTNIGSTQNLSLQQQYAKCPEYNDTSPIAILMGYDTFGRTANQLWSFQRAIQYSRDNKIQLGIWHQSWAMDLMLQFFMVSPDHDWKNQIEEALCVKVINSGGELKGRQVIHKKPAGLFKYGGTGSREITRASQTQLLQTFFRHYNTGSGTDHKSSSVQDMCSGIDTIFGQEDEVDGDGRSSAIYSVIHLRSLEKDGYRNLRNVARWTGCDPVAALEMKPEYVKSILESASMMKHPIVVITDGQNMAAYERLKVDPEIGPMVRLVPNEASWLGGDITLATMANVFIGNPASTLSLFIAQSRDALGIANNFLYMKKDPNGVWGTPPCGDVECLHRQIIL